MTRPRMACLRLLTVLALFAACSAAQQPPVNPSDQKPIRVEGRVFDLNGAAVRKAAVHLQGAAQPAFAAAAASNQAPAGYSQASDDAGRFAFDNVTPGTYTLSADKTGFLQARYGARSSDSPAVPLAFVPGDSKKGLDLKMIPQGVIVGRVLDQDGDPVANAQVTAARYGYINGHRTLIPASGALTPTAGTPTPAQAAAAVQAVLGGGGQTTDDQGVFRISNLAPGRYYVSADARANRGIMGLIATAQGAPAEATSEPVSIVTYYPNTADAGSAAPVIVAAGSEVRGIDIRVRKARVYSIRGKVVDTATGGPVSGAMVLVLPPDVTEANAASLLSNMSQSGADGGFEIRNLLPGTYSLQGLTIPGLAGLAANVAAGGRGGPAPAPVSMTPKATTRLDVSVTASNVTGAVLQLSEGGEIPGIVRMDEGNLKDFLAPSTPVPPSPIPGLVLPGPANRAIRLTSSEGADLVAPRGQFADDGAFMITEVFPGKYFVTLGAMPQGTYVKSISLAGREIARAPLDLTAGAAGSLEVVLSAKAADVSGSVRTEKGDPLQGVPVTLWLKTPDRSRQDAGIHTTDTDQNGSFKIAGLAPGDYYVAAWDDIPEAGLNSNPAFLARFQSDDTAVKLTENGHVSADVKLILRERIVAEMARMPSN
jgi:protocatechuate 3,4-dioxygenase beta subunit